MDPCISDYMQLCLHNYALHVASNTLQVIQFGSLILVASVLRCSHQGQVHGHFRGMAPDRNSSPVLVWGELIREHGVFPRQAGRPDWV